MNPLAPTLCVEDYGIKSMIPDSFFSVLDLVEVRNRLRAYYKTDITPDQLASGMNLTLSQVYAALAYYHENQALFDNELKRRGEEKERYIAELMDPAKNWLTWAEIAGSIPNDEPYEEIREALERIS